MVGRTKYDLINAMIEELNTVTVSKYKIIDSPVNKLNSENMRRFNVSLRWSKNQEIFRNSYCINMLYTPKMRLLAISGHVNLILFRY